MIILKIIIAKIKIQKKGLEDLFGFLMLIELFLKLLKIEVYMKQKMIIII